MFNKLETSIGRYMRQFGATREDVDTILVSVLENKMRKQERTLQSIADRRKAQWRVRVRIYSAEDTAEPHADSDPEIVESITDPSTQGAASAQQICTGLDSAFTWAHALATDYHNQTAELLVLPFLERRIQSLRTGMSRKKSRSGRTEIEYTTADGQNWVLRIDVFRMD